MKEQATAPFTLTLNHPKYGGSTEIELSAYTNWSHRMNMANEPASIKAIKQGLGAILSKYVEPSFLGLLVDQMFKTTSWSVKPVTGS